MEEEKEIKRLIIKGTVKDVIAIMKSMLERHGKDVTIAEILEKYNKDELILL